MLTLKVTTKFKKAGFLAAIAAEDTAFVKNACGQGIDRHSVSL